MELLRLLNKGVGYKLELILYWRVCKAMMLEYIDAGASYIYCIYLKQLLEHCARHTTVFYQDACFVWKRIAYEILSLNSRGNVICRINTTKDFTILLDFLNFVFCISPAMCSDGRLTTVCQTSHTIRKPVTHFKIYFRNSVLS